MTAAAVPELPGATPELVGRLQRGLGSVNDRLSGVVQYDDPFIAEASGHLLAAGGKRFRPLLALLSAEVGEGINDQVVTAAAGVELTHLASLYHDDVMDEAALRRGVPSANALYDNSTAILVGDLLFGKASALIAELGSDAVRIQAETFVRLCAGQIRDARQVPADVDAFAYYLQVLADKTGVLIATAARYGAMFSGCSDEVVDILTRYGELLGVAFQLSDDLLDVTSDSSESGKTPGTDLREGVATLPVLYARQSTDPDDARLAELLSSGALADDAEHAEALALLRAHPAIDEARRHTERVADEAIAVLDPLPASDAKSALIALVDRVVHRDA